MTSQECRDEAKRLRYRVGERLSRAGEDHFTRSARQIAAQYDDLADLIECDEREAIVTAKRAALVIA